MNTSKELVNAVKEKIGLEFPRVVAEHDLLWAIVECAIEDLHVRVSPKSGAYAEQAENREDAIDFLENGNWVADTLGIDRGWIVRICKESGLI